MKKLLLVFLFCVSGCSGVVAGNPPAVAPGSSAVDGNDEKPLTIVAVGDISCSSKQRLSGDYDCVDEEVAELSRNQKPDYVFALGDIQYNSHQIEDFNENFAIYWLSMLGITKPIAGNHEYAMSGAKGYYESWPSYSKPGYYSFDLGSDWHVIAINTNDECKFVYCDKGSEQYKWVEKVLEENKDKCIIAMGHQPRYSSGVHGSSSSVEDMYGLFSKNGVFMYLSAHDHHYERISSSVSQYIVGTGGQKLRKIKSLYDKKSARSEFSFSDNHGVLRIDIYLDRVDTKFISLDGQVLDKVSTPSPCSSVERASVS